MPVIETGQELSGWSKFFAEHRPYPLRLRQWVMKLHRTKQHKQVIACLQAALINGQSQPWMYEVLALSMEIEGFPKDDVDRVVVSMSDFGAVNFETMMYSAEYLTRFDRKQAALRFFRQASNLAPENHRSYVWGLKLAGEGGSVDDLQWAVTGVLQHYWADGYEKLHRQAEDAVANRIRDLERTGDRAGIDLLRNAMQSARKRDLIIRVDWNGEADIDLSVEEPPGSVCSFETPLTYAGGIFRHDGIGPEQANCFEEYICPQAVSGTYKVQLNNALGQLVGNRATLTITKHAGTNHQEQSVHTIDLSTGTGTFSFKLSDGRREKPRDLSAISAPLQPSQLLRAHPRQRRIHMPVTPQRAAILADYNEDEFAPLTNSPVRRAGAIGFAPVVQVFQDGAQLNATAVVSADRRYVRIGIAPSFSTITGVFTWSLQGGGGVTPFPPNQGNGANP